MVDAMKATGPGRCPPLRNLERQSLNVALHHPIGSWGQWRDVSNAEHRTDALDMTESVQQLVVDVERSRIGNRKINVTIADDIALRLAPFPEIGLNRVVDVPQFVGGSDLPRLDDRDTTALQFFENGERFRIGAPVVVNDYLRRRAELPQSRDGVHQHWAAVEGNQEDRRCTVAAGFDG